MDRKIKSDEPEPHSKLKGAAIGAAIGKLIGGKKSEIAGAAIGAKRQSDKNKKEGYE